MEYRNTQHRRNVRAVLTVGILLGFSGQFVQDTAGISRSDVSHLDK